MIVKHVEEDFRFATETQVANYSPAELILKPHISGFEFSQLLDQIDGQVIASNQSGIRFKAFVRAPGGTALWLAKHLKTNDNSNELMISIEPEYCSELLVNELLEMKHVRIDTEDYNTGTRFSFPASCSVLACRSELLEWFTAVRNDPCLQQQPILALDPDGLLQEQAGDYFAGSTVWRSASVD